MAPREIGLMQAAQDGLAVVPRHAPQHAQNSMGGTGIEAGHWLIGKDDPGLLRKDARNRHTLLLSA